MLIVNTEQQQRTSLIVDPFGTDGAVRLVPVEGDQPGRAFILDAQAARELTEFVAGLQR